MFHNLYLNKMSTQSYLKYTFRTYLTVYFSSIENDFVIWLQIRVNLEK